MISLDEIVVWRAERRRVRGAARSVVGSGRVARCTCLVEGTAEGLSPPADATWGLAGHKIVSQPARRRAAQ
eukprot:5209110-Prymnesium_polylepis.1